MNDPAPDRPGLERAKRVAVVVLRERALRQVVGADALVASLTLLFCE